MSITLSTHVLNLTHGTPAENMQVKLLNAEGTPLSVAQTNSDGRIQQWPDVESLPPGLYDLTFMVEDWWQAQGIESFYPCVSVHFRLDTSRPHYHVPLLVSPYGYSTYRGS